MDRKELKDSLLEFSRTVGGDIKILAQSLAAVIESQEELIKKLDENIVTFELFKKVNGEDKTKEDFLEWLKHESNVEKIIKLWINESLLNSNSDGSWDGFDTENYPRYRLSVDDFDGSYFNHGNELVSTSNAYFKLKNDYPSEFDGTGKELGNILYVTKEKHYGFEFTNTRNGFWVIIGKLADGTPCALNMVLNNGVTGGFTRILKNASGGPQFSAYFAGNNRNYAIPMRGSEFTNNIPIGSTFRFITTDRGLRVLYKLPNEDIYREFFHLDRSRFAQLNNVEFGYFGFLLGVSPGEYTNSAKEVVCDKLDVVSTMYALKEKKEKYAVVCVVGQSNAVGYDESPILAKDYPENPRLLQLGIYDNDNMKLVPLSAHAHSWQDMRSFTNPMSELQGTKGMHYHLAKAISEKIPEDYKVVVISSTYGGTGFLNSSNVGDLDLNTLIPNPLKQGWVVSRNSHYYKALIERIKFVMDLNHDNAFIGVVFCQGENDYTNDNSWNNHYLAFFNNVNNTILSLYGNNLTSEKYWYWLESCKHWKTLTGYNNIINRAKNISNTSINHNHVAIPVETHTNAVNGTGATSSNLDAHYGDDSYRDVIVPAIIKQMELNFN